MARSCSITLNLARSASCSFCFVISCAVIKRNDSFEFADRSSSFAAFAALSNAVGSKP